MNAPNEVHKDLGIHRFAHVGRIGRVPIQCKTAIFPITDPI